MTNPHQQAIPNLSSSIFHSQYPEIHWETLFIDSKFYIASPDSIQKLRQIEGEIQKEKNRIGSLGKQITDAKKRKGSLQMKQSGQEILEDLRVSRECATQVNFTKQWQSKIKAEGELNEEQKKYTGRIHQLKLRRSMKLKQSRIESNIENSPKIKSQNFIEHKNDNGNQFEDQKSPKFNQEKQKSIKSDKFGSKHFSHISINFTKNNFQSKTTEKEAQKHFRMNSQQNKQETDKSMKKVIEQNFSDNMDDDKNMKKNKSVGKEMMQIQILNCKIQQLTQKLLKIQSFQEKYLTKVPQNLETQQLAHEYEFSLFERNKMEALNLSQKQSESENNAGEKIQSSSQILQKSNPLPKFSFEEQINNQENPIYNIGLFKKPKLTFASSIVEYSTESSKKKQEQKKEEESQQVQELKKMIRDLKVEKMRNLEVIKMLQKNNVEPNLESIQKQQSLSSSLPEKQKVSIKNHNKINKKDEIKNNQSALSLKKRIRISKVHSNSLNKPHSIFNQEKVGKGLQQTLNPLFYRSFNPEDSQKKHFQSFSLSQKGLVARQIDTANENLKQDKKYENERSPKKHQVGNYEPSSPSQSGKKMFELEFIKSTENKSQNNFTIDIPEIQVNSFQVPQLPQTPSPQISQTQLYQTAKQVCAIFDIKLLSADNLHMKKYKNCIIFKIKGSNKTIVWHYNGKLYVGGWEQNENGQGKKNGEGFELQPKNYAYQGQFLDGKKNGSGIMIFENGDVYDGQWLKGLRNGHGSFFQKQTEAVYKGQWKDDKKEGKGILKVSQNEYYDGTFVKSIKQGYGKELFSNGDFYQGQYKSNQFHGNGKYFWANGSFYDGAFDSGKREGFGSWRSSKQSADIYNGQYKSDKKSGKGQYIWHNGIKYNGYFFNDLKHGEGHVEYQNGRKVKGFWENGKLIAVQQNIVEVGDGNLDLGSIEKTEDGMVMNVKGF